jgi:prepilin-type N-terminal cleavage/methylation domain-containing protein
MKRNKPPSSIPGFSLIELALVLIVIGILAGAVFKGRDVLEAAKMRSVLSEIERIRTAYVLYHDTFGQWPGNDAFARARFGDSVANGLGNGFISADESAQVWVHLAKAESLPQATAPSSKLGGQFSIEGDPTTRKNMLILSGPEKSGLLTPKQAASLKSKAGESDPSHGQIHVLEGVGVVGGACVREGAYNLSTKVPACILKVELN